MSDVQLTFDGSTLSLSDEEGTIFSTPAVSGDPGYQDSRYTHLPGVGPLPEGAYSFSSDEIQTASIRDEVFSYIGAGAWPAQGGYSVGWGSIRASLTQDETNNIWTGRLLYSWGNHSRF
jgi:hypothetical protein